MDQTKRRLLTVEETADFLKIKPGTIYNGIHRKSKKPFPVKPKRVGRLIRFDERDLNRFLDSQ